MQQDTGQPIFAIFNRALEGSLGFPGLSWVIKVLSPQLKELKGEFTLPFRNKRVLS